MTPMCFGLITDHAFRRPYHETDVSMRPRRELSLIIGRQSRSQAIWHRKAYRVLAMHRRSVRAPEPPVWPSPLRAA
jgi:hypothetical protein